MARPKKKPTYDSDQMAQQIMEAVTDVYLNPSQGTADDTGHMQLKSLAEAFSMTPLKVRKLLITTEHTRQRSVRRSMRFSAKEKM